jgi:uracil-DNA glycosylase
MSHETERARSPYNFRLDDLVTSGQISPDWAEVLIPVQQQLNQVADVLNSERAQGNDVLPDAFDIFRAFRQPFHNVRVLIVGQDPYPTPGHPVGLAFACGDDVRPLPRSLNNIFTELSHDLGLLPALHGDLSEWSAQGVMLMNRVLTVRAGLAGSHRSLGWEQVTECAIDALVARGTPLVSALWGRDAQALAPRLAPFPVIESAHPSPLSARRGFFGSRPFSRANALLEQQGATPISWGLTEETDPPEGEDRLF